MTHLGVTPLVGQLVVEIGADNVGIRTVNGEVERFDAGGDPLVAARPAAAPAAKDPHDWEDVRHTYRNRRQIGR